MEGDSSSQLQASKAPCLPAFILYKSALNIHPRVYEHCVICIAAVDDERKRCARDESEIAGMEDGGGFLVLDVEAAHHHHPLQSSRAMCPTRIQHRSGADQEQDVACRKLLGFKAIHSHLERLMLWFASSKAFPSPPPVPSSPAFSDSGDGRHRRYNRLAVIRPRNIMVLFAALSSIGTMILIYFTLAVDRGVGGR